MQKNYPPRSLRRRHDTGFISGWKLRGRMMECRWTSVAPKRHCLPMIHSFLEEMWFGEWTALFDEFNKQCTNDRALG